MTDPPEIVGAVRIGISALGVPVVVGVVAWGLVGRSGRPGW